jgi:hypothetical protein
MGLSHYVRRINHVVASVVGMVQFKNAFLGPVWASYLIWASLLPPSISESLFGDHGQYLLLDISYELDLPEIFIPVPG